MKRIRKLSASLGIGQIIGKESRPALQHSRSVPTEHRRRPSSQTGYISKDDIRGPTLRDEKPDRTSPGSQDDLLPPPVASKMVGHRHNEKDKLKRSREHSSKGRVMDSGRGPAGHRQRSASHDPQGRSLWPDSLPRLADVIPIPDAQKAWERAKASRAGGPVRVYEPPGFRARMASDTNLVQSRSTSDAHVPTAKPIPAHLKANYKPFLNRSATDPEGQSPDARRPSAKVTPVYSKPGFTPFLQRSLSRPEDKMPDARSHPQAVVTAAAAAAAAVKQVSSSSNVVEQSTYVASKSSRAEKPVDVDATPLIHVSPFKIIGNSAFASAKPSQDRLKGKERTAVTADILERGPRTSNEQEGQHGCVDSGRRQQQLGKEPVGDPDTKRQHRQPSSQDMRTHMDAKHFRQQSEDARMNTDARSHQREPSNQNFRTNIGMRRQEQPLPSSERSSKETPRQRQPSHGPSQSVSRAKPSEAMVAGSTMPPTRRGSASSTASVSKSGPRIAGTEKALPPIPLSKQNKPNATPKDAGSSKMIPASADQLSRRPSKPIALRDSHPMTSTGSGSLHREHESTNARAASTSKRSDSNIRETPRDPSPHRDKPSGKSERVVSGFPSIYTPNMSLRDIITQYAANDLNIDLEESPDSPSIYSQVTAWEPEVISRKPAPKPQTVPTPTITLGPPMQNFNEDKPISELIHDTLKVRRAKIISASSAVTEGWAAEIVQPDLEGIPASVVQVASRPHMEQLHAREARPAKARASSKSYPEKHPQSITQASSSRQRPEESRVTVDLAARIAAKTKAYEEERNREGMLARKRERDGLQFQAEMARKVANRNQRHDSKSLQSSQF